MQRTTIAVVALALLAAVAVGIAVGRLAVGGEPAARPASTRVVAPPTAATPPPTESRSAASPAASASASAEPTVVASPSGAATVPGA
jgi:hypothetical protein